MQKKNKNKNRMDNFYQKYLEKIFENSQISENNSCRIWTKCKTKSGYGKISYKCPFTQVWKTINAHRLSYIVNFKTFPDADIDVSHLCSNKLCVSKEHLCPEPRHINIERQYCFTLGACTSHSNGRNCLIDLQLLDTH